MNFSDALKNEERKTFTENGATAFNSTSYAILDLFGTIGSLRMRDESSIRVLFDEAYKEDSLRAMKILFYARDIRDGLGERRVFRVLLKHIANTYPNALKNNLKYISEFGRWDDIYDLIDTKLEDSMWEIVYKQLAEDIQNMQDKKPVSLLAKWLKTADSHVEKTRKLGIYTANKLGMTVIIYKKIIKSLRKYIDIVEAKMSTNKWDDIKYSAVPSRAMNIYKKAFYKHDHDRFYNFMNKVSSGEETINASTLYPYDIVRAFLTTYGLRSRSSITEEELKVLEAQWKALPNYVSEGTNAIVMADVSGSMTCNKGLPLATSVSLALYFAERNTGAYNNIFMTFSGSPEIVKIKGNNLFDKVTNICRADWGMNTNLEAAFMKVLNIAKNNNVSNEEMVKSIIVISDMEIDYCASSSWSFYDEMRNRFEEHGYTIPNIVFWNVNARNSTFHVDKNRKGVQLCSGSSPAVFKSLIDSIGLTPLEMMYKVIDSDRYSMITIA